MRRSLILLPLAGLVGYALFPPAERPVVAGPKPAAVECRWADTPIVLDGSDDDPAWKHAQVIENFAQPWLGDKAPPLRGKTRAKLLWDREYLYFLGEMEDSDLYALIKEHNGKLWENDVFELFFKPAGGKPGYYEFQVNAAGATLELFFPRRGSGGYDRNS